MTRLIACVLALACVVALPLGYRIGYGVATRHAKTRPAAWRVLGALPHPHVEAPTVLLDGRLYLFGGFHNYDLHATTRVDVLDLKSGAWSRAADLPIDVTHVVPAVVGDSVWLAGGFVGNHPGPATERAFRYHVAEDRWHEEKPLPAPRAGGGLVAVGAQLHYFGGLVDRNANAGDHWMLNTEIPSAGWQPLASMPEARGHFAALAVDGRIYAVGGQYHHDRDRRDLTSVHAYDPETDSWETMPPIPEPTSHHEASTFVHERAIVVLGGRNDSKEGYLDAPQSNRRLATTLTWIFDLDARAWRRGPNLPLGLLGASAVKWDGRWIIGAGSSWDTRFPQLTMYSLNVTEIEGL